MYEREERLLRAIGGVGSDLIDTAEHKKFRASPWRRLLPAAACLAILAGAGLLLRPMVLEPVQQEPAASTERPAEPPAEEPAEQPVPVPEEETSQDAAAGPVQPKERLTVLDGVYYVEGVYDRQQAEPLLAQSIGTVQRADRPGLAGSTVYARAETTWKDRLPLEIFVETEDGYLYCLTYFVRDKALQEQLNPAQWPVLLENLALPRSLSELTFREGPAELDADGLVRFFGLTVLLEQAGDLRTADVNRYLWFDPALQQYVVPVEDLRRQVDRYLEGWTLEPEKSTFYDPVRQAFLLPPLQEEPVQPVLEQASLEGTVLTARLRWDHETVEYALELGQADRCSFLHIRPMTEEDANGGS